MVDYTKKAMDILDVYSSSGWGTIHVDGKTYLIKQGRNFWNEYIRTGYVLDTKLGNKCIHWNMKEFHNMCRVKES